MATMLNDIVKALRNLGGQATLSQIYDEVERIRTSPLPKTWQASIRGRLETNSSDSASFEGKDYFRRVGPGIWALRGRVDSTQLQVNDEVSMKQMPKDFSAPESFEAISNYLKTIKEYRDFSDPASPSWIDYVQEFFHVMGFSTEKTESRIILLRDMRGFTFPRAIVGYVLPGENYDDILPGLTWDSYLLFAANHYHVMWGVLTNGLQLKVVNYGEDGAQSPYFWSDLDGIIENQRLDSFITIHKVFSYLRTQDMGRESTSEPELETRHELRLEFWRGLLSQARTRTPSFINIKATKENWISTGAGKSGFGYAYVIRMNNAQIELYIDQGNAEINKQQFDTLHAHRERIEQAFGEDLDWQRLDYKRACRVRYVIEGSGLQDREEWPELQKRMIDKMIAFERALKPEIRRLPSASVVRKAAAMIAAIDDGD